MSGSHKWAKPACDCPFDGRVRPRSRSVCAAGRESSDVREQLRGCTWIIRRSCRNTGRPQNVSRGCLASVLGKGRRRLLQPKRLRPQETVRLFRSPIRLPQVHMDSKEKQPLWSLRRCDQQGALERRPRRKIRRERSLEERGGPCVCGLTFDMSGSHKWAKPACDCPFDGRVRPLPEKQALEPFVSAGGANATRRFRNSHGRRFCLERT